jgi:hypothetical protein
MSNLIGAAFSVAALTGSGLGRGALGAAASGLAVTGFAITGFAVASLAIAGFAMGLGAGLFGFTVTFDVASDGLGFAGGRAAFLGAAAL